MEHGGDEEAEEKLKRERKLREILSAIKRQRDGRLRGKGHGED